MVTRFVGLHYLPASMEATAAIKKDRQTAGPAVFWATWPATTYIPAPNVLPIPEMHSNT